MVCSSSRLFARQLSTSADMTIPSLRIFATTGHHSKNDMEAPHRVDTRSHGHPSFVYEPVGRLRSLMSRISSSELCTCLCISYTDLDVLQTCVSTAQTAIYYNGCMSPGIAPTMGVQEQLALVAQHRSLYCLSALMYPVRIRS
jgi:hypothetical protein